MFRDIIFIGVLAKRDFLNVVSRDPNDASTYTVVRIRTRRDEEYWPIRVLTVRSCTLNVSLSRSDVRNFVYAARLRQSRRPPPMSSGTRSPAVSGHGRNVNRGRRRSRIERQENIQLFPTSGFSILTNPRPPLVNARAIFVVLLRTLSTRAIH